MAGLGASKATNFHAMATKTTLKHRHVGDEVIEAGVDEAGRGSFWGPIVAAAVVLPPEDCWSDDARSVIGLIKDSKKLSPKKRAEAETLIRNVALSVGVGMVSAGEIDQEGMTWANQMAFIRAVEGLDIVPQRLLIDGILSVPLAKDNVFGGLSIDVEEVVTFPKGDNTYLSIAAASIIAKEAHDRYIRSWAENNPTMADRYSLLTSMGYGTATHRQAIRDFGPHEEHRRRFLNKTLAAEDEEF
jgi:ribonuclease HII